MERKDICGVKIRERVKVICLTISSSNVFMFLAIRLSTTIVADWSILVFLRYRVATKPAMRIQYILSPFISRI